MQKTERARVCERQTIGNFKSAARYASFRLSSSYPGLTPGALCCRSLRELLTTSAATRAYPGALCWHPLRGFGRRLAGFRTSRQPAFRTHTFTSRHKMLHRGVLLL